jgi:polysaccharide biosynthesis/export protein
MHCTVKRFLFLLCGIVLAAGALSAQNGETAERRDVTKPSAVPSYVIQPNDILEIYVWKEPELTRKVLVRPDGRISFPLVQDLQAAGLTAGDIKADIERELKKFIEVPNVTVIVDAIQSYRVFVTGKVIKPGAIAAEKPITVLQALSLAGGFMDYANLGGIVIVRNSGGQDLLYRFNYPDVIKGANFNQNMFLKSGDVVVVP